MDIQRIILDETFEEELAIGLLRLAKNIPNFEFFFHVNRINTFCFERIEDLIFEGKYFRYSFPVFMGYCSDTQTTYRIISNKSSESYQRKEIVELFVEEQDVKFLLNNFKETDYIIKSSDTSSDFSLLLMPENLTFQIQDFYLSSHDELYHILQYYE